MFSSEYTVPAAGARIGWPKLKLSVRFLLPGGRLGMQRVVGLVQVVAPVARVGAVRERSLPHVPEARQRIRQRRVRVAAGRQRRVERVGRRDEPEARRPPTPSSISV